MRALSRTLAVVTRSVARRCVVVAAIAVALGRLGGGLVAADEPAHWQTVRQLGDASFATRQRAEQQLIDIGIPAREALMQGMRDEDLEVRLAAHRILIRILQEDFDSCVATFIQGSDKVSTERFPGWQRFRQRVADDAATRRLYVEMIRAESSLLTALEHDDPNLFKRFGERLKQLTASMEQANAPRPAVSAPALAAWLFVGVEIAEKGPTDERRQELGALTRWLLYGDPDRLQAVIQSSKTVHLKKLLALWIESSMKDGEGDQAPNAMQLVLKYDLAEPGVKLARQVLEKQAAGNAAQNQPSTKPYAAIVLARFGGVEDARYLIPHLDDKRVFHTWSNPQLQQDPISIQVRDVVLAMLLRLRGKTPEACGFELLEPFPETVYRIWTYGFLNERLRDETFAKWRDVAVGTRQP